MHPIRPRTCVLWGAIIGLVGAVSVYSVVSSSAIAPGQAGFKPATVALSAAPVYPAGCPPAQSLAGGVCVVHLVHVIVAAGPGLVASPELAAGPGLAAKHDDEDAEVANAGRG